MLLTGDLTAQGFHSLAWAIVTGGFYHFFILEPAKLDPLSRRWIRFAARVRRRYWREFTSSDVFVPDVVGDPGVRVMGYRHGNRQLIVGAPLQPKDQPDRPFRIAVSLPTHARGPVGSEWLFGGGRVHADERSGRCLVEGRGPFLLRFSGSRGSAQRAASGSPR